MVFTWLSYFRYNDCFILASNNAFSCFCLLVCKLGSVIYLVRFCFVLFVCPSSPLYVWTHPKCLFHVNPHSNVTLIYWRVSYLLTVHPRYLPYETQVICFNSSFLPKHSTLLVTVFNSGFQPNFELKPGL